MDDVNAVDDVMDADERAGLISVLKDVRTGAQANPRGVLIGGSEAMGDHRCAICDVDQSGAMLRGCLSLVLGTCLCGTCAGAYYTENRRHVAAHPLAVFVADERARLAQA